MIKFSLRLSILIAISLLVLPSSHAQRRDFLTELEADQVREAQEIDKRMDVFIKAIERRMWLLNGNQLSQKDAEKFGTPGGTRAQLLNDISRILLSAIDNLEYIAEKDAQNKLFPKSVHLLAEASRRFLPQLETYRSQYTEKMEQGAILTSIDYLNQIIEASAKVPREAPKEEKKKKSSRDDSQ
jgi:hypothetical protein